MFAWLKRLSPGSVVISNEEAITAINALRRSANRFDMEETLTGREMRAKREKKLAEAIGARIVH